jgi:16S rRNA (guanine527-N7)-methyltransferase
VLVEGDGPRRAADLGSGGGVPGLPLALQFPACRWVLVEASVRRAAFLREAAGQLGIGDRVSILEDRAEVAGRHPAYRAAFDLVVARSFGPPAVLAECAAPLLRVGGRLVVSEPPGGAPERWPAEALGRLAMTAGVSVRSGGATFQVLRQTAQCPDRYPRRVGVPAKRPLF